MTNTTTFTIQNTTPNAHQNVSVQELTDKDLEQINGGFFWKVFLVKKLVKLAAKGIAKMASKGQAGVAHAIKSEAKIDAAFEVGTMGM